jgi:malate synthase
VHKAARLTEDDPETGARKGDVFTRELFERLYAEEMEKLRRAGDRDVHEDSKGTSLPVAGEIVEAYVASDVKSPWYIDLLNLNLDNFDLETARRRIRMYLEAFGRDGTRITKNLDFA